MIDFEVGIFCWAFVFVTALYVFCTN
uniref:Uncharacterized protein n=1 Tax=Rhizophora mucronata TaxID=61149 RepID=A0A2P2PDV2_RHIMU